MNDLDYNYFLTLFFKARDLYASIYEFGHEHDILYRLNKDSEEYKYYNDFSLHINDASRSSAFLIDYLNSVAEAIQKIIACNDVSKRS